MSSKDLAGYDAVLDALDTDDRTADERAVAIDAAAELVGGWPADHDAGITARAARALATTLVCLADFERWEAGTASAEVDAERHRRSAEYKARTAAEELDAEDPVLGPLRAILERIAAVRDLGERTGLREDLARIPSAADPHPGAQCTESNTSDHRTPTAAGASRGNHPGNRRQPCHVHSRDRARPRARPRSRGPSPRLAGERRRARTPLPLLTGRARPST